MARGITIRWSSSHYVYGRYDGVRVRIEAVCATEMDPKIFAYRMLPLSPQTSEAVGFFDHICSPPDLADYPEDEPRIGKAPEWFRLSYVDILVRSVTEADDFIEVVLKDVRRLKATLDVMDTITPTGEEVIGELCDTDSSSSSSSSEPATPTSSESLGSPQEVCAISTLMQNEGPGVAWTIVGSGASSPLGSEDSESGSLGVNYARVSLLPGESSKPLLLQGYDFSAIPAHAEILGISVQLAFRNPQAPTDSLSLSEGEGRLQPRLYYLAVFVPALGLGDDLASRDPVEGPEWVQLEVGGEDDLAGFPEITREQLADGAFGVLVGIAHEFDGDGAVLADVDGASVCVTYREIFA